MIGYNETSYEQEHQTQKPASAGGMVMGEATISKGTPDELEDGALPREQVEQFLFECRNQPAWRREADRCCDYYDNNQLSPETVEKLKDRGQPPLIKNLIKPTIDTVLGMEAKSRTDWRVRPEDDNIANDDTAEALSLKLKHAETESRADRACSDAYAGQIKAGVHWVEVARESDPLKYPYRVKAIHRKEIHWDWRSVESDLSDARYLIRRRWLEVDNAIGMMPQYAELFRQTTSGWAGFDQLLEQNTGLVQSWEIERDTKLEAHDWRDSTLQQLCLYEIWYRKWVRGYVMTTPGGASIQVDFDNPRHVQAIASGMVKVKMATFQKIRLAWYCGPHFLYDVPSPHDHCYFPYVPFFGYREDQTGVPYGLIRTMMSPQDEINARASRMLWSLNSRTVIADADAVADHAKTAEEIARPDAYVILNSKRTPQSRFEIKDGGTIAQEQFQIMQESKQEIAETSGIHKSLQGQQSGAKSGLAINSLVEQGMNTLGEINDNFRFARRMVGEMLFTLIQQDLAGHPTRVTVGKGNSQKEIILNMPVVDQQTGQTTIQNDTQRVRAKVVLDDVASTPTFRMQQLTMLTDITRSLPPDIQALVMDFIVEATDLNGSYKIADRIRRKLDLPDDSPEGQQAQQQAAQRQQAIQDQSIALEMQLKQAKIGQLNAAAAKTMSEAQAAGADSGELAQMQQAAEQQVQELVTQIATLKTQLASRQYDADTKLQTAREKNATDVQTARIASATQLEVAAIAHPVVDLNAVLQAVQALTERFDKITTTAGEKA